MVTPVVKRRQWLILPVFEVSQRRACLVIGADRTSIRYRARGRTMVRSCPAAGAGCARRRFGYRRLQLLLRREGTHVNHKKLRRLYVRNGFRSAVAVVARGRSEHGLR